MTKTDRLAEIVGGKAILARMCGVSNSRVSKFNRDCGGELPVKHRAKVLAGLREAVEARDSRNVPNAIVDKLLAEALTLLPEPICPTCGSPLEGRVV